MTYQLVALQAVTQNLANMAGDTATADFFPESAASSPSDLLAPVDWAGSLL